MCATTQFPPPSTRAYIILGGRQTRVADQKRGRYFVRSHLYTLIIDNSSLFLSASAILHGRSGFLCVFLLGFLAS